MKEKKGLNISTKSFVTSIAIIFVLMVLTYGLTFAAADGIPFWKWILSPVLVLGTEDSGSILTIIASLLIIGGIFNGLEKTGQIGLQSLWKNWIFRGILHRCFRRSGSEIS